MPQWHPRNGDVPIGSDWLLCRPSAVNRAIRMGRRFNMGPYDRTLRSIFLHQGPGLRGYGSLLKPEMDGHIHYQYRVVTAALGNRPADTTEVSYEIPGRLHVFLKGSAGRPGWMSYLGKRCCRWLLHGANTNLTV